MSERDEVREALVDALDHAPSSTLAYLAMALGVGQTLNLSTIADALLSRAEQREGEAVPVTFRIEDTPDGDLMFVFKRYECARPALPADVQAVVERVSDALTIVHPIEDLARLHYDSPTHPTENVALYAPIAMEYVSVGDLRTLLAHIQRQGTPVVVTEAMVEAAARAQYELEHTDLPWERCGSLFADGYREDARAVLTAALAARGED